MQISLNIKNENILDKLLWMLEHFKNDGVEIIRSSDKIIDKSSTYKSIEKLNKNLGGDEFLELKLKNMSIDYEYIDTEKSDEELFYESKKEKYEL